MKEKLVEDVQLNELKEIKKILLQNQKIMKEILNAVNCNTNPKEERVSMSSEMIPIIEEEDYLDPFFCDAVEFAIEYGKITTSMLQRKFRLGYRRACRILEKMEENEIIPKVYGIKPREVLISKSAWEQMKKEKFNQE